MLTEWLEWVADSTGRLHPLATGQEATFALAGDSDIQTTALCGRAISRRLSSLASLSVQMDTAMVLPWGDLAPMSG